jgi:hypothetical protein
MVEKIVNTLIKMDKDNFSKKEIIEIIWEIYKSTKATSKSRGKTLKTHKIEKLIKKSFMNKDYFFFNEVWTEVSNKHPDISEPSVRTYFLGLMKQNILFSERVGHPQRGGDFRVYSFKAFNYGVLEDINSNTPYIIRPDVLAKYKGKS